MQEFSYHAGEMLRCELGRLLLAALDMGGSGERAPMHTGEEVAGSGLVPVLPGQHAGRDGVRVADANGGRPSSADRHAGQLRWEAAPGLQPSMQQPAPEREAATAPSRPAPAEPVTSHLTDGAAALQPAQHGTLSGGAAVEVEADLSAAHEQVAAPAGALATQPDAGEEMPSQVRQCAV